MNATTVTFGIIGGFAAVWAIAAPVLLVALHVERKRQARNATVLHDEPLSRLDRLDGLSDGGQR